MASDRAWRIATGRRLLGATLQRRRWTPPHGAWDHDHCACCWAKFGAADIPDLQHEGYTTTDAYARGAGYEWVCDQCVADLSDDMQWRLAPAGEPPPPIAR